MHDISKLHVITHVEKYSLVEQIKSLCEAKCDWIQLRAKNLSAKDLLNQARIAREITKEAGTKLLINDSVDICAQVKADGVHLGSKDLHPQIARNILGANKIIGFTVNSIEDAHKAASLKNVIDYVGVGPFRSTQTKENHSEVLSSEMLQSILEILEGIPAVLIGGIQIEDLKSIKEIELLHGIAVASAIVCSESVADSYRQFAEGLNIYDLEGEVKGS